MVAGSASGLACIASDPLVGRHYTGIKEKVNPMMNRMRVSGTLGKRLKESKVSPDAVLRQAGLPLGLFQQGKILLTTEEMFALYNAIEKISGDPGIGLKLGSDERPEHYSAIAIAGLYTRSFRDAMDRIARYKRLNARELGTSTRTLQRRLLDEGMSFHSLVEEARRELAKHYLLQSSLELNEIGRASCRERV